MLIDLPRGAQLPVGSSNIVYRCFFQTRSNRHIQTWYANSHPSRAPSTSRKVPLSARPRHRPAVPESSAPGPPPGLHSLVHRATISAPSSSPAPGPPLGPCQVRTHRRPRPVVEVQRADRARRASLTSQGCPCLRQTAHSHCMMYPCANTPPEWEVWCLS